MMFDYKSNRIVNKTIYSSNNLAIPNTDYRDEMKYGNIIDQIYFSNSINIGYLSELIMDNSSLKLNDLTTAGPSVERFNHFFQSSRVFPESTFNNLIHQIYFLYDVCINYKDSMFYQFDEYLLF